MYFEYWVEYFNEIDNILDKSSGVVYADTYYEAVDNICVYYGDQQIVKLEIRATDDDTIYECEVNKEKKTDVQS